MRVHKVSAFHPFIFQKSGKSTIIRNLAVSRHFVAYFVFISSIRVDPGPRNRNSGRFAPITCSPRKVSRFAPLNRYYIIIDEVFFDNFLVIIYLLVVCKKNNNSFILVYFNYLFISCIQKKNNSFMLVYFCQRSKRNCSCKINKKNPHKNSKKVVFFVPTQKCMK
jgi:hypothetical protein